MKDERSLASVIREVLASCDDPERIEGTRLLVLTRARLEQLGISPSKAKDHQISQTRQDIRHKMGSPITPDKVRAYIDGMRAGASKRVARPTKAAPSANGHITVESLMDFKAFTRRMGGTARVRELLNAYEELVTE